MQELKHKIDNHYRVNMLLDNLPVTVYDLLDEVRLAGVPARGGRYLVCATQPTLPPLAVTHADAGPGVCAARV